MLKEMLQQQYPQLMQKLISEGASSDVDDLELCELSLALHRLASRLAPDHPEPVCRVAEAHHLLGQLREAGQHYRRALELDPPAELTADEQASVMRYAPLLHTTGDECFELMDVVAIHHPNKPMIAYHLFWEDDYNFPDDYEPCDHEQVWVAYDPRSAAVTDVWAFYHSRVITTPEAADAANRRGGNPDVYVQWGTHGSLLAGWEKLADPACAHLTIADDMKRTYEEVSRGGRLPEHPLKRSWPSKFAGTYEDYVDFSRHLDASDWLRRKGKIGKTAWSNAMLQQYFLTYNFHPKFDWPN